MKEAWKDEEQAAKEPTLARAIGNSGWLFLEKLAKGILGFGVTTLVVRYLGVEQFGQLTYALSIVALVTPIATLGLDRIIIRDILRYDIDHQRLFSTAVVLKLIGGLVAFGAAALVSHSLNDDPSTRIIVYVISSSLLIQPLQLPDLWFQADLRSKFAVIARTLGLAASAAVKIALILVGASLIGFAWAEAVTYLVTGALLCALYLREYRSRRILAPTMPLAIRLLRDSWPLILSGMSIALYMKIDQVMLKAMTNTREVGLYGAACSLSEPWYFIPSVIVASAFPGLMKSKEAGNVQSYRRRAQSVYDLVAGVSITLALGVTLFSGHLVTMFFGIDYVHSAQILRIHIWAYIFVALGLAQSRWLVAENMTRFVLLSTAGGAAANIVLNALLIPYYGGIGAAWATLISYASAGYLLFAAFPETRFSFSQMSLSLLSPFRYAWRTAARLR